MSALKTSVPKVTQPTPAPPTPRSVFLNEAFMQPADGESCIIFHCYSHLLGSPEALGQLGLQRRRRTTM